MNIYRALAFNLVFLYHAGFLPGGFVGVDIFFVISGFLIYGSLTRLSASYDQISIFWGFLYNRSFRLLPSLTVVTSLVVLASFIAIPDASRAKVLVTAATSIAGLGNYYQAFSTNYFDLEAIFNPLTHLWTISIEMQFYLVLLILFSLFRRSWHLVVFGLLTCVSIATLVIGQATSDYMLTVPRIYSFLAGSILFIVLKNDRFRMDLPFSAPVLGCCLIVAVSLWGNELATWREMSMVTTACTILLVLHSHRKNSLNDKASVFGFPLRLFERQGEISYSLYLTHYPVLSIYYWLYGPPNFVACFALYFATIALSLLIYKLVENRFAYRV